MTLDYTYIHMHRERDSLSQYAFVCTAPDVVILETLKDVSAVPGRLEKGPKTKQEHESAQSASCHV